MLDTIRDTQADQHCWDKKTDLLTIWNDLPQELIDITAIVLFHYRLQSCVAWANGDSELSV